MCIEAAYPFYGIFLFNNVHVVLHEYMTIILVTNVHTDNDTCTCSLVSFL